MPITLISYLDLLRQVIDTGVRHPDDSSEAKWEKDVASLHQKQWAYGSEQ